MAMYAFASALEQIPIMLAMNSGMDYLEKLEAVLRRGVLLQRN